MGSFAFVVPVLAGKDAVKKFMEGIRERMDEYVESHTNAEVTLERTYLMSTPQGEFMTGYFEAKGNAPETMGKLVTSGLKFDAWAIEQMKELTGVDFSQPPTGPPPELILDYFQPTAPRKRGLGFGAPLVAGKTDSFRKFCAECNGLSRWLNLERV